jgi:hypothetical protein
VTARNLIGVAAFVVWATMISLTLYELFTNGPDILILISLVFVGVLGVGIFGALSERRGGPR